MKTPLLDKINQPEDLKKLQAAQLAPLCAEIRAFLLEKVSKTGGHLASNLGVVELTVAVHRVFHSPIDKLIFDVGHQCYTHKLLTGRKHDFDRLRQMDGISGFPNPRESEHDAFISGHGNTAISVAIGIAQAKKLKGEPGRVIAVIGDGAFTGGMVYEGLNNVDSLDNLIVILNDNKMSISKNVGAMARYLNKLRTAPEYFRAKENVQSILDSIPVVGSHIRSGIHYGKSMLRRALYHSTMFEDMGFLYVGPVDGHNVDDLSELFAHLEQKPAPYFIHVVTKKGKGYGPAEQNPGEFHGVSTFDPSMPEDPEVSPKESFSTAFGKELLELGKQDSRICAITAAMKYGTGLQFFHHSLPERFFDVGMAEQHAVTFAAGLASQGLLPVVGIYSTFLQRSYDQLIHDVCLLRQNVLFAIDRAGLVPADGETHQGIYDPAYLSGCGIPVYSPANYAELRYWLGYLLANMHGPIALRYPRGGESPMLAALGKETVGAEYELVKEDPNQKLALVSYGSETEDILKAAAEMEDKSRPCTVFRLVKLYPLPDDFVSDLLRYDTILFAEECIRTGGIGQQLLAALHQRGWVGRFLHHAIDAGVELPHATVPQMKAMLGLDADSILKTIEENSL